ncbi:MAG: hypothetical protein ACE5HR_00015 [bacterium]
MYLLQRVYVCSNETCKCKEGQLHNYEYVFKRKKYSKRKFFIGSKEEVGFPPDTSNEPEIKDLEFKLNIQDEVNTFVENLKEELNINGSLVEQMELDFLKSEYYIYKVITQELFKSRKRITDRTGDGDWKSSNLTTNLLKTIDRLRDSLGKLRGASFSVPSKNATSEETVNGSNYNDLLASL